VPLSVFFRNFTFDIFEIFVFLSIFSETTHIYDMEKTKKRKYLPKWEFGRPWLAHRGDKMFCITCEKVSKFAPNSVNIKNNAFIVGSTTMKLESIIQHETSKSHKTATIILKHRQNPTSAPATYLPTYYHGVI
ncbi:unnamed protein product, partial [Owenia fusiformis]